MDENLTILLLLAVSIAAAVALVVTTRWMKIKTGDSSAPLGPASASPALTSETEQLRTQVRELTDRLAALEDYTPSERPSLTSDAKPLR